MNRFFIEILSGLIFSGLYVADFVGGDGIFVIFVNIIIKDSIGGGSVTNCRTDGGYLTIEGVKVGEVIGVSGRLTVIDCTVEYLSTNAKDSLLVKSGSFDYVGVYFEVGTLDDLLGEGCGFYDADSNLIDTATLELEGSMYYLNNVTVAPIN